MTCFDGAFWAFLIAVFAPDTAVPNTPVGSAEAGTGPRVAMTAKAAQVRRKRSIIDLQRLNLLNLIVVGRRLKYRSADGKPWLSAPQSLHGHRWFRLRRAQHRRGWFEAPAPQRPRLHDDVQHGRDRQVQNRRYDHAAEHDGTKRIARRASGAGRKDERRDRDDEGNGRHQDRPQPRLRGARGRRNDVGAGFDLLVCEFHDQNCAFARKTDQHDEADLRVRVAGQSANVQEHERSQNRDGNRQKHDQRIDETLVLRGQHQEYEDDADEEDQRRQRAAFDFVERGSGPLVTDAGRIQFLRELLHRRNRLSGAVARCGGPVQLDRAEQIVVRDDRRRFAQHRACQAGERHHPAGLGAHVEILQRIERRPVRVFGLHVHAIRAIQIIEIVYVERAEVGLHRAEDVVQRHADVLGFLAIDVNLILRGVDAERRENVTQVRILIAQPHESVSGLHQRRQTGVAPVLEFELEAAEITDALDRRRIEREDLRARNAEKLHLHALEHRVERVRTASALRPGFEPRERDAAIGTAAGEAEPRYVEQRGHFRLRKDNFFNAGCDRLFLHERCAFGQLNRNDEVPLVFIRNEGGRRAAEEQQRGDERRHEQAGDDPPPPKELRQHLAIPGAEPREPAIEPDEECEAIFAFAREHQRRHHRRERQRGEERDGNRCGNGQRELLVELPRRAREKSYRHEDREQDERRRNDRALYLLHCGCGAFDAAHVFFLNVARDIFDHDDRVVYHQARRERKSEQRNRVDREAEDLHHREGADERNGQGHRGNDRRSRVLQEQKDDQHDQEDREHQREDDFLDGFANEVGGVERDLIVYARGERAREQCKFLAHTVGYLQRIGRRQLHDAQADDVFVAVEIER